MPRYNPAIIEPRWQQYWEHNATFATPRLPAGGKRYVLDMFPYPSGEGLHVGHPEGYTATDIVCRFERMRGQCVLHPMGFDSFGLPAEEHAIKTGEHPGSRTQKNINTFRDQLKMLGFSYDWGRELATTDIGYVRWTQWIFLQLYDTWYDAAMQRGRPIGDLPIPDDVRAQGNDAVRRYQDRHRLAYQTEAPVNWCPALGTVLANEEVIDGKSEVGGHPVERRPLRQWMLRITAYADRLERDLDPLDWSESIKTLQRNWIGRSVGAECDFFLGSAEQFARWQTQRATRGWPEDADDDVLRVYTTRPDTLYGATYLVVAPEHPLVPRLTTVEQRRAVEQYGERARAKSDLERTELAKEKTGVFSGSYAFNPVNGQPIPIWIADYVLISYGTGAIMSVPAHDVRDFEFAQTFGLPVIAVVDPGPDHGPQRADILAGRVCFVGTGIAIQSGVIEGLDTDAAKSRMTESLTRQGWGRAAVNYKLRDWLFSRQRFWGEPIPILHELNDKGQPTCWLRPLSADQLPLELPHLEDFRPHGRPDPILDKAPDEWLYPVVDGRRYKRETNTMPQWAGSCWYYLRFLDPHNDQVLVDPAIERAWMPVDLYVGGAEHAVLHLLYARFWHKVLYDRGVVSSTEPFRKLVNQGMILGEVELTGYQTTANVWVSAAEVMTRDLQSVQRPTGEPVHPVRVEFSAAEKHGDGFVLKSDHAIRLESRAYKMSKSRGNVINPDTIVAEYGADSLRLYEMFMGPLEATKPWSTDGVNGVHGFLNRVWRLIIDERCETVQLSDTVRDVTPTEEQQRILHKTIKVVTRDLESLSFNTAIARLMEFVNFFSKQAVRPRAALESFVLLLAPLAPHIAEELWQVLGHAETLAYHPWPVHDETWAKDKTVEIPLQVNGKVRGRIEVAHDIGQEELLTLAQQRLSEHLSGASVVNTIVIPGRMVNFVIRK